MATVYLSIGNSDDKLSQQEWSRFLTRFRDTVASHAVRIHGDWVSHATAPWQNACICAEIDPVEKPLLRDALAGLCTEFRQNSIAWAVAETEFLQPSKEQPSWRSLT